MARAEWLAIGNPARARAALREVDEIFELHPDAFDRAAAGYQKAKVLLQLNDRAGALAHLANARQLPTELSAAYLRNDLRFAALRSDPVFAALVRAP